MSEGKYEKTADPRGVEVGEIVKLLVEDELLWDAKKLYGMEIEPRGKELYFLLKKIRKENPDLFKEAEKEKDRIYGGAFSHTKAWDEEWRAFKKQHNLGRCE